MTGKPDTDRYHRQMLLPGIGPEGQKKLSDAKVLVIGAGGLGCPAMQYLAAAGIGTIGIIDHDIISLTNLHRQVLYSTEDIGSAKVQIAAVKLKALNPGITINSYPLKLSNHNALEIIKDYDIIVDGTDNFPSRYMINDACVLLNKPLVYGAISQFEGQVAVFNIEDNLGKKTSYRDLFPEPPGENEVLNCSEAGVLGVLPGIIGTMQANEVIKLITGTGKALINKLMIYNSLNNQTYELSLQAASTNAPVNEDAFLKMDYKDFCGISEDDPLEINTDFFDTAIKNKLFTIIDVREEGELPLIEDFEHLNMPLSEIKQKIPVINADKVIFICQTGKRSLEAVQLIKPLYSSKELFSLKGGLVDWMY